MRHAARALRRTPGASVACILTLALGIGSAAAIFGVAYGVLLRPLPFADPGALVQVNALTANGPQNVSLPEFDDWKARTTAFERIALVSTSQFALAEGAETSPVPGAIVSGAFFQTLGAPLRLGRGLMPEDDTTPAVVVSERLWRQRLGADPAAAGRVLRLNGDALTVVGVAGRSFRYPAGDIEVWVPVGFARRSGPPQWNMRGYRGFSMIARLRPGTSLADARADAGRVARDLGREFPRFNRETDVAVAPLLEGLTRSARPALLMLMAAALLVLLATSANVANLLLARGLTRRRDAAVRLAIGADRRDLARQALAEAGLIALAGAAGGLAIAQAALWGLQRLNPATLPRLAEVRMDWPVLLFTAATAAIAAIAFGGASSLQMWRTAPGDALREGWSTQAPRVRRINTGLVLLQIAASVVLLIGGAVLIRSVSALLRVPVGVRTDGVYAAKVNLAGPAFAAPAPQAAFLARLLESSGAVPGVAASAVVSSLPPAGSQMRTSVALPGRSPGAEADVVTEIVAVSQDAFSVLGVPLLGGRVFAASDSAAAPRVLILSELAAKRLFPGQDPLGRTLPLGASSGGTGVPLVVGIVGDVRYAGLDAVASGAVYLPFAQRPFRSTYLIVRTPSPGAPLTNALRQAVSRLDPGVAIAAAEPMDALVADAAAQPRFRATLLAVLSGLVLCLAAVGLYGVMAQAVTARRAEFAVRLALGAQPRDVLVMVVRRGLNLTAVGVALGVVAGFALVRLMTSLVFGVSALDAVSFVVASVIMGVVGLAASAVPAMRAARVAPAVALKG